MMDTQELFQTFYPDLEEKGGLGSALQSALFDIHSPLMVKATSSFSTSTYASAESGNRFSQVYIAAEERLFVFDFWKEGVMLATGRTSSLDELARSLNAWMINQAATSELCEEFHFVTAEEKAEAFEKGREVEWKWQECLAYIPRDFPDLVPFLTAARQNEVLRRLFPFTSLNRFCFSRCTGYPYSYDCPIVSPLKYGYYEILDANEKPIGRGNAIEAVNLVLQNLPPNCGHARKGTARDLNVE